MMAISLIVSIIIFAIIIKKLPSSKLWKKIILTNGFVKKTQKTPKKEIELAKKYRKIYLEREDLL